MKLKEAIDSFPLSKEEREKIIEGDHIAYDHNFKDLPQNEDYVPDSFIEIAQSILSGHFQVMEGGEIVRRVYPTCVEIYYHEEAEDEDAVKDYIVYHRDNRNKENTMPGTFRLGSLNTHQSGIDITFEHKVCGKVVRASALIRKYKMVDERKYEAGSPLYVKNDKVDDRSTYLYEALFADLSILKGFSIQWVDGEEAKEMTKPTYRKNVLPYENGNKKEELKNDGRCWQFSIEKNKQ